MDEQNRNLLLATALSFLVLLVWMVLFPPEDITPPAEQTVASQQGGLETADGAVLPTAGPTSGEQSTGSAETAVDAPRIEIETPKLIGSISLQGGRIDDLELSGYRQEVDETADLVRLLRPVGQENAYYALYGWAPSGGVDPENVPGPNTIWTADDGARLTPDTPVTMTWDNGAGLVFTRTIAINENYMFDIEQSVENTTNAQATLAPYGIVARHGEPETENFFISHEGVVRVIDGEKEEIDYDDMPEFVDVQGNSRVATVDANTSGWIGFTDKYWMTTLIPEQGSTFRSTARYNTGSNVYQTETIFPTQTVAAGATISVSSQLFSGAKEWELLRSAQNDDGIDRFLDAIDWGWFFFLTKPIFWLLHNINAVIGNMGWSIICLTLIIKSILLPLAWKSFVSMARMKELQPEMEKLKESAGEDRQKMQQGMMKLYKDNKVNPASGCLPILAQIPIFFSLYKVIFVTLELRHAPWIGWIKDLSAPDPSSIINLFGLLPFDGPAPGTILALVGIGVMPIVLGITMWLQQKLNPAPTDPTQKMIFAWMPWVFMFMLGSFASGLVLYWIANNTITFIQQYSIMRANGHKPDLFGNISSSFKRAPKPDDAANTDKAPKDK